MLHGIAGPTTREQVLGQLHGLAFHFYLTGSRYFEESSGYSDTRDVDLFTGVVYSDVVGELPLSRILQQLGFKEEFSHYFRDCTDTNLFRVFRHPVGIDIQLVHSVPEKMQTQLLIKHYGLLCDVPKEDHGRIWQKAHDCVVNINFLHQHSEENST